ncbi:FO synthase subunit 2 [Salsuginibacillus halophilus]|uniref:FO synthase n=1 Tax=Salsuginibacillus halophilus TaxID=517424 RepID=A0A2P8HQN7_9BACI|nr:5-amino-6-(D-ribitylamino)uracil--L-tyrosine 4-hydroxyphenyl transferase CofH [Salsuginibacillus halophilus]PSL48502.1 FO synthase subunit 2 [Salsuginibacillus halophilus]
MTQPIIHQPNLAETSTEVRNILQTALDGKEVSVEDARKLAHTSGADLDGLVAVADAMRSETVGERVTFTLNRNINFTNVCFVGCKFCGFSRTKTAKDAYFLSVEDMVAKTKEAWELGAREVCIQGGLEETMDPWHYIRMVEGIKEAYPDMHIHAYSPMEIDYGAEITGLSVRDYLQKLKAAGLGSVPGTAAEILDDRIRGQLSPVKLTADRWEEIIRTAHEVGLRSTSTMMYGHVEEPDDWVYHMERLRNIQRDTGGFTEFVPLGFIHYNTHLFRIGKSRPGASMEDHLKIHALARVFFHGFIENIQISWVKMGPEEGSKCLHAGANDFGGTLMEENISKEAGSKYGEYLSGEAITHYIEQAGREPWIRDTLYENFASPYVTTTSP